MRHLTLTEDEREDLIRIRDRDPRPYMRERAAGLLKIAEGQSARQVALHGLLKSHSTNTLYRWLDTYERTRTVPTQPVRRKAFSPSGPRA